MALAFITSCAGQAVQNLVLVVWTLLTTLTSHAA